MEEWAAWEAAAVAVARRLGVDAYLMASDLHRGDPRVACEVTGEQMWAPVLRRLYELEEASRPAQGRGAAGR